MKQNKWSSSTTDQNFIGCRGRHQFHRLNASKHAAIFGRKTYSVSQKKSPPTVF